jgi:hypothetical protein
MVQRVLRLRSTTSPSSRARVSAGFGLALSLVACAHVHFDGQRFSKRDRHAEVAYLVGELGPAWQRADVAGSDLVFHREGHGSIAVTATCHDYDDVPVEALVQHLLFGSTERVYLTDEEVTLDGRGARHTLVKAELDGVPVQLEMYVLVRDRCVFDLSHVGRAGAPSDPDFTRFVQAFHVDAVHRE